MTTRLILVRHGESIAQAEGFVGGPKGCRGLSPLGKAQVRKLRDRWRLNGDPKPDVLLASTLPRARETAEILDELWHLGVTEDQDLCEIVPGECDGLPWEEYEERFGTGDGDDWGPYRAMSPGGESWWDFQDRVSDAIARIVEEHDGRTIVAAVHGGVIDGSMVHFLGLPRGAGHVLQSDNAGFTEWHRTPHGWRLLRFNDHAHVE